jgi:hypothetical protein
MVHKIHDMPTGTVGLQVTGDLTRDKYRSAIEPPLRDAVASGEIHLMLVAGPDFDKMAVGAASRTPRPTSASGSVTSRRGSAARSPATPNAL